VTAGQLSLFAAGVEAGGLCAQQLKADAELMQQLRPELRFGTSSWAFPGWAGIVYSGRPSERSLAQAGLQEYARHPLFRSVGIDRSYYRPLVEADLKRYAEQLPRGFKCVHKVYARITSAVNPRTREPNPEFLDVGLLEREVLRPLELHFSDHIGPLVLELMPLAAPELPSDQRFIERLAGFVERLPKSFQFAIELRNRELLIPEYADLLGRHGVSHVFNFWERMPWIAEQLELPGLLEAGELCVSRLMIPPGKKYAKRKLSLAPFDALRDPQPRMRAEVTQLAQAALRLGKVVYVIANNKAEGCSPLSVRALAQHLVQARVGTLPTPDERPSGA